MPETKQRVLYYYLKEIMLKGPLYVVIQMSISGDLIWQLYVILVKS